MAVHIGFATPAIPLLVDVEALGVVVVFGCAAQAEVELATRLEMLLALALLIWAPQWSPELYLRATMPTWHLVAVAL